MFVKCNRCSRDGFEVRWDSKYEKTCFVCGEESDLENLDAYVMPAGADLSDAAAQDYLAVVYESLYGAHVPAE